MLVLVMGPSGVGKSTLIRGLCNTHPGSYEYVMPYTTRTLRDCETDKIHITLSEFESRVHSEDIFLPNKIYGNLYGPSKKDIYSIMRDEKIPLLDWPVDKAETLKRQVGIPVFDIYVIPPNLETLNKRLMVDGRDTNGMRYEAAINELAAFENGLYKEVIDAVIVSEGRICELAEQMHGVILEHMV